jgi:hypothetical protein
VCEVAFETGHEGVCNGGGGVDGEGGRRVEVFYCGLVCMVSLLSSIWTWGGVLYPAVFVCP